MFSLRYLFVWAYADIAHTCGCEPEASSREPHHSTPFIFETGLSMNMRLMHWLNRLANELRDLPTSAVPALGLQTRPTSPTCVISASYLIIPGTAGTHHHSWLSFMGVRVLIFVTPMLTD